MTEAINNYVVLQMHKADHTNVGAIELAAPIQHTPRWGTAISVGPGVPDFNGQLVKPDVEVGDLCYVAAHGQHEIKMFALGGKENLHVASVLDVLCTLKDMETKTIQPLGAYIEFEKFDTPEEKIGDLYVPDVQKFPPNAGRVKTIGLGWKNVNGEDIPFQVQPGDIIIYNPFAEMTIDLQTLGIEEKKFLVLHGEIMAVYRGEI